MKVEKNTTKNKAITAEFEIIESGKTMERARDKAITIKKIKFVSFNLIEKIWDYIDKNENQNRLIHNKRLNQLESALISLEDSSCAVNYYVNTAFPDDLRGGYFFLNGLLQSLFIQQDAINSIYEALFNSIINFQKQYPDVYNVREIRNDVVGHPTKRRDGKLSIQVSQSNLRKDGFTYLQDFTDGSDLNIIPVKTYEIINNNTECINDILSKIVTRLDKETIEYINLHRSRKMIEIFKSLDYAKSCALTTSTKKRIGYDLSKTMVDKCKKELDQRYGSWEEADSYKGLIEDIDKIFDLIDNWLAQIPAEIESDIERCLLENLFEKLDRLKEYCKETDNYFEHYGEKE